MKQAVHAPSSPLPSHSPLLPASPDNRAPSSNPLIQVSRRVSLLCSVGPCPSHPHSPAQRSIHHPAPPRHPRELPVIDTSSPGHTHTHTHAHAHTLGFICKASHTHALGFIFNLEPVTPPGHSQTPARPPGRPFNRLSAQGGIRHKDKSRTPRLERNSILLT